MSMDELFEAEVQFEAADEVDEPEAQNLIASLAETGASATILARHKPKGLLPVVAIVAVVGVSLASVAGLTVIAAFIYRVFKCGVIIDLTHKKARITKNRDMPRGSLLFLYADGRQEYREGISDGALSTAIRDLIALAKHPT
jgi:hypothetical protein